MVFSDTQLKFNGSVAFHRAALAIAGNNADVRTALDWASDDVGRLDSFVRVQPTMYHVTTYPFLVIEARNSRLPWKEQSLVGRHELNAYCFVTGPDAYQLGFDIQHYANALTLLFLAAPRASWTEFVRDTNTIYDIGPIIEEINYGEEKQAREADSSFLRSFALRLVLNVREVFD